VTMNGITSANVASRADFKTSARVARGAGWIFSLRTSHHHVNHRAAPSIRPGTIPAMNSREIDTLAATPKMTKPMLGGMIGAMMLAADNRPADRAVSYPARFIMGSNSAASAAASATAEPDSAAMMMAAMIPT